MSLLIRSQVLTGYASLTRSLGAVPEPLLDNVGLDLSALADLDARISANAFAELLERTADATKTEDFGLRLAMSRSLGILGPVGLVLRDEPNVRAALRSLARYAPIHNEALELAVSEKGGLAIVSINMRYTCAGSTRHVTELSVGAFYRILRQFLGSQWNAARVCFRHKAPENLVAHRRFFNCQVEFEHEFYGIVCRSSELDVPISMSDSTLALYAHRYLESIIQHRDASVSEKVREIIRLLLPSGECTSDKVARRLGVERRTVHRHLSEAGETFSSVRHDVRKDLAGRLLSSRLSLNEIAGLLGFSSPATFSRWFKQVFGSSPSDWRERQQGRTQ